MVGNEIIYGLVLGIGTRGTEFSFPLSGPESLLSLNPMFHMLCKQRAELCCLTLLISGGCYCSNTQPILTQIDNQLR